MVSSHDSKRHSRGGSSVEKGVTKRGARRRRRLTNIAPTLSERLLFAEIHGLMEMVSYHDNKRHSRGGSSVERGGGSQKRYKGRNYT